MPFLPICCIASMNWSPAILSHAGKCVCWWQHLLKWEQLHSEDVSSTQSQNKQQKEEENLTSGNQKRLPRQQRGCRRMAQVFAPWICEKGMGPHWATSLPWHCELLLKINTVNTVLPLSVFLFLLPVNQWKNSSITVYLASVSLSTDSEDKVPWRPQTWRCPFYSMKASVCCFSDGVEWRWVSYSIC